MFSKKVAEPCSLSSQAKKKIDSAKLYFAEVKKWEGEAKKYFQCYSVTPRRRRKIIFNVTVLPPIFFLSRFFSNFISGGFRVFFCFGRCGIYVASRDTFKNNLILHRSSKLTFEIAEFCFDVNFRVK